MKDKETRQLNTSSDRMPVWVVDQKDMSKPGIGGTPFTISFYNTLFIDTGSILKLDSSERKFVVITEPHKKWWKLIFQFLSLGFYKAPWQYQIKRES